MCLYYLSVSDGVIVDSHLRIDMLQVPAEAPAVHFLPQRYTLWHVPKIHSRVLDKHKERLCSHFTGTVLYKTINALIWFQTHPVFNLWCKIFLFFSIKAFWTHGALKLYKTSTFESSQCDLCLLKFLNSFLQQLKRNLYRRTITKFAFFWAWQHRVTICFFYKVKIKYAYL